MSEMDHFFENTQSDEYSELVKNYISQNYIIAPKAFVHAYGCQQSVYDSERYVGILTSLGYVMTDNFKEADLILYNTCAVRENAEKRVLGNVGSLKGLKDKKKDLIIAITGCMTEQDYIKSDIKKKLKHVNIVLGSNGYHIFPQKLYETLVAQTRYIESSEYIDINLYENIPVIHEKPYKAFVPIMYGCDNFCSYCIVPYVRGRERSRKSEDIIKEVNQLVQNGCKEITLLGQNVNSYGKGLDENINFSDLLKRINQIPGDFRIRFMTSHPKDCSTELIDTIAMCQKVCNQLHLPVQSGSDRILELMNRRYTVEHYCSLIEYARKKMPDIAITTDIIVGFPGETKADFNETLDLINKIGYCYIYSFNYSRRKGTRAELIPDVVSMDEKSKWYNQLLAVQYNSGMKYLNSLVGKELRVLVESNGKNPNSVLCRSSENVLVEVNNVDLSLQEGNFIKVSITNAMNWALKGEILEEI